LENCGEAQKHGKTFHYAWLLLSIVLVARELPEDNQFSTINRDLSEAVKYASLWATKDSNRICNSKIFWVFMEINLKIGINRKLQLSPTVFNILQSFSEFKADIHSVYIKACEDSAKQCRKLPFVAIDDVIFKILETWLSKWRTPDIAKLEKLEAQRKKEEVKQCIVQLAEERRKKAVAVEEWMAWDTA